ncbi:MAG: hypothetical protein MUO23_00585 [Anaerolineales bacterium]|nr:hypothetical protein [Anaerolineales bacterium]
MVNLYGLELEAQLRLERSRALARTARQLGEARLSKPARSGGLKWRMGEVLVRLGRWLQGNPDPRWSRSELAWK